MKALVPLLLIAAGSPPGVAQARQVPMHSPLLGRWAVDLTRMEIPPAARPKSVTITFSEQRAGKWQADVDIRDGDGSRRHMWATVAPDGTAVSVEGDSGEADSAAMKLPAANVLVIELGKGGVPASTRVYTVAPDGRSMIETAGYAKDGKPFLRTNYFKRIE